MEANKQKFGFIVRVGYSNCEVAMRAYNGREAQDFITDRAIEVFGENETIVVVATGVVS